MTRFTFVLIWVLADLRSYLQANIKQSKTMSYLHSLILVICEVALPSAKPQLDVGWKVMSCSIGWHFDLKSQWGRLMSPRLLRASFASGSAAMFALSTDVALHCLAQAVARHSDEASLGSARPWHVAPWLILAYACANNTNTFAPRFTVGAITPPTTLIYSRCCGSHMLTHL